MQMIKIVPCVLLLGFSSMVTANDYPTAERVEYVMNCLQDMGRNSMDDLQTCSCRIDSIASEISFETYNYGQTYERNKRMTGEKGAIFRDNEAGRSFAKELKTAKENSESNCKQVVQLVAPTDLTREKKYEEIRIH